MLDDVGRVEQSHFGNGKGSCGQKSSLPGKRLRDLDWQGEYIYLKMRRTGGFFDDL